MFVQKGSVSRLVSSWLSPLLLFPLGVRCSRGLYCRGHVDSILPFNRLGNKTLASIIYLHYRYFTPTWTRHVFMVKLFSIIPRIWITREIRPTDRRYNSLNFQKFSEKRKKVVLFFCNAFARVRRDRWKPRRDVRTTTGRRRRASERIAFHEGIIVPHTYFVTRLAFLMQVELHWPLNNFL